MKELPDPNRGNLPARYQYVDMPPPPEGANEPETGGLIEYWHILRRRKGTVLLAAILGTIAAILFSLPQTPLYQARATLEMLNINEDLLNRRQLDATTTQDYYDPQFNIKTQISILQSKTLADRVNQKLKPKYPSAKPGAMSRTAAWRKFLGLEKAAAPAPARKEKDEWAGPGGSLSVRAMVGTRLVQVLYDSPDPKFAADYVNTIASEFIDQNVEVRYQASQRTNVLARIRNEYDSALRREKLLTRDYTNQSKFVSDQSEKSIHYSILKREVDTGRQIYDGMLQKVKEYGIASAMQASSVRVVDAAEPPLFPYKPDYPRNSGLGLLAGLFLGVAFVIVRERADRSIQAPGEASQYVDAPELGIIPSAALDGRHGYYSKRRLGRPKHVDGSGGEERRVELVTWQRKPSLVAESFRAAVASILFSGENGNHPRVIVMTSPAPKEGKTTVASNLALALAEINRRVLLIDGDVRKPRLHEIFNLPNDHGLTEVLKALGPMNGQPGIIHETSYPGLYVMPAGPTEVGIHNMLYSPRLPEIVARFRKEFDIVLIDTPPMLNMSDARVMGRLSDGVIIVMRAGRTTRDSLQSAVQRFAEDGTTVIGTILNDWNPKKHQGYGYGYAYRSYHGYYDSYYKHYGPEKK